MEITTQNRGSLASQSAWLLFAKLIGFVLSFILPLMIFRILDKASIGIYNQVFLVITIVGNILPFGFSMSAFYFLSREKERKQFFIFNILLFNFFIGGIACLTLNLFPSILGLLFKDDEMTKLAPQIGVVLWLWLFSSFLDVVAIANREAKLATVFIIISQLTKMIFMVSAVLIYSTVEAMLNAITIQVIMQTIALLLYLNKRFSGFWKSFDMQIMTRQLRYALPFGFMGILWIAQTDGHNFFVGNRFSPEEVAVYRAGCFELPLLIVLYESIASVMIPRMSELQVLGRHREMIELSVRAMEKLSLFYFPSFVFFLITSYTLITTLFTKNFSDSVPIFVINILLLPFYIFMTDPIVRSFESLGRFMLKVRIIIVFLLLISLYYGIQHFTLQGMISIVVASAICDRLISFFKVSKTVGATLNDIWLLKHVGRTALIAGVVGLPTYFVYGQLKQMMPKVGEYFLQFIFQTLTQSFIDTFSGLLTLSVTGFFFASLYLLGISYFGVISYEERALVKEKLIKIISFLRIAQTTQQKSLD
jgi:O-antigen/teichoic acid export membrane protein